MKSFVSITTLALVLVIADLTRAQLASVPMRLRVPGSTQRASEEWGRQAINESDSRRMRQRNKMTTEIFLESSMSMSVSMSLSHPTVESDTAGNIQDVSTPMPDEDEFAVITDMLPAISSTSSTPAPEAETGTMLPTSAPEVDTATPTKVATITPGFYPVSLFPTTSPTEPQMIPRTENNASQQSPKQTMAMATIALTVAHLALSLVV